MGRRLNIQPKEGRYKRRRYDKIKHKREQREFEQQEHKREQRELYERCGVPDIIASIINIDPGKLGAIRDFTNRIVMYTRDDSYCCPRCFQVFTINEIDKLIEHTNSCTISFDSEGLHIYTMKALGRPYRKQMKNAIINFYDLSIIEQRLRVNKTPDNDIIPWRHKGIIITYVSDGHLLGMLVTEIIRLPARSNPGYCYFGPYKLHIILNNFALVAYARRHEMGKAMFDEMISYYVETEHDHRITPKTLLYHYPSISLVSFLKKWYRVKTMNIFER